MGWVVYLCGCMGGLYLFGDFIGGVVMVGLVVGCCGWFWLLGRDWFVWLLWCWWVVWFSSFSWDDWGGGILFVVMVFCCVRIVGVFGWFGSDLSDYYVVLLNVGYLLYLDLDLEVYFFWWIVIVYVGYYWYYWVIYWVVYCWCGFVVIVLCWDVVVLVGMIYVVVRWVGVFRFWWGVCMDVGVVFGVFGGGFLVGLFGCLLVDVDLWGFFVNIVVVISVLVLVVVVVYLVVFVIGCCIGWYNVVDVVWGLGFVVVVVVVVMFGYGDLVCWWLLLVLVLIWGLWLSWYMYCKIVG